MTELAGLVATTEADVDSGLALVMLAEDEIEQAMKRHPDEADLLFHSFRLLVPAVDSPAWGTEFVYRGHARELLERVAAGADTRPGTAAECCLAMSQVSLKIPLHGAASGFYFRLWRHAFPDHGVWPEAGESHERLYAAQIDDHERYVRRKLSQPSRRLVAVEIECDGTHWGQAASCRFAGQAPRAVASPSEPEQAGRP